MGKGLSEKLQQLQNRAARIIVTSSNYQTRSKDILDELGWEVLEDRQMRQLAILMYKKTHGISPLYLRNIFANVSDVHHYNLRNSSINLYIPKPKLQRIGPPEQNSYRRKKKGKLRSFQIVPPTQRYC